MLRSNGKSYLLVACLFWVAGCSPHVEFETTGIVVFEGALLITGDEAPPIEDSAFVGDNGLFTAVGRRDELQVPAGAERVDLTGTTVMPDKVDLHGHLGYQHAVDGTMAKEYYTRENLIDHLERLAYFGVGAVVGIGDLVDRSDLGGGRSGWGEVPLRIADFVVLDANPLDDIANSRRISQVYLRGREVDRDRLKAKWLAESRSLESGE